MKMPSQLVVFTLLVVGCGGRAVDACDLPLSVETYEIDTETQARRPLSERAGCFEPNSDARVEPFVVCVEARPGERESLSASVKLEKNEHLAGLEYSLLAGADDVRFYVEHDGGTLECPTLYQDNAVNLENLSALCVVTSSDGRVTSEYCPCSGTAAISPSSINSLRWEASQNETSTLSGRLCVARSIYLCTGDCLSRFE